MKLSPSASFAGLLVAAIVTRPAAAHAQVPAQTEAATTTIDRAVAAWADIRALSGTFDQVLVNPLMGSTSSAHGEFKQQRPNKLSIKYSEPAGDEIVSDGKYLWVYLREAAPDRVIRRSAADARNVPVDIGQFLDQPQTRYSITAAGPKAIGGRPTHALLLSPKAGVAAPFTRATVWVDDADGLIRQFEVVEQSGNTRRIHITKLTLNPTFRPTDFAFVVPKGAKVITP
jgi:outer membrane lipoprotein carrier protein